MIAKRIEDFGGTQISADNSAAFALAKEFFKESGGGTLILKKGVWRTGPIELVSNMTLEIEEDAVLSFIPEFARYRPVKGRWNGTRCYGMHACIYSNGAHNVAVQGRGVIDGNGERWWKVFSSKKGVQKEPKDSIELELASLNPDYKKHPSGGGGKDIQFLRPPLLQFYECKDVACKGVTLQNSPFWTLHPVFCDRVTVENIAVQNPYENAPNTDGMDIDSCSNVAIRNCFISAGDDAICIKSGSGDDGIEAGVPSENIEIAGCKVERGHGGIVIGSETAGGIRNITAHDCTFFGTDRGIRIKTRRGRGGKVEGLRFDNLEIKDALCPIAVNMYYKCGADEHDTALFSTCRQPVTDLTPSIKSVAITHVHAAGCRASAGFIAALPESKLSGLEIKDCTFSMDVFDDTPPAQSEMYSGIPDAAEKSFRIINAEDPVFDNVKIEGAKEPFLFE